MSARQRSLFDDEPSRPGLRDIAETVKRDGLDGLTGAVRRGDDARYQDIDVRSALSRAAGMYFRWALNPYRGCTHACAYCYARKYQRHLELDTDSFSTMILVKRNLPDVLRREVTRRTWAHETVAIGTATDPYQPIEGDARLTRRCLEVLVASETPFSIITKGPMVVRDIDVLRRSPASRVFMSVPSIDDEACARLEPGTAAPRQRLRAARRLSDAGVDVAVLMMPLVPGITTSRSSVERTMTAIAESGVRLAGANVAHLDDGVRDHFIRFLSQEYPDLVAGYARLYRRSYATHEYVTAVKAMLKSIAERVGLRIEGGDRGRR